MQLTKEEYNFLNEKRTQFETVVNSQYVSQLDGSWLNQFGHIYIKYFNMPFKSSCGACVKTAMQRMWNLIVQYESQVNKAVDEIEPITDNKKENKNTTINKKKGKK